jgi:GAF domain-containing protein
MDFARAEQDIRRMLETKQGTALDQVVAYLQTSFPTYSWVGLYVVSHGDLVLGPWKGAKATEHTRIPIGVGICGAAAASGKTEVVADVSKDARYLSCFRSTRSEIVVPIFWEGSVIGEIDIDSEKPDAFTADDAAFLEAVAALIATHLKGREDTNLQHSRSSSSP